MRGLRMVAIALALALAPAWRTSVALTLEHGHVYSTSSTAIWQFDSSGTLVESMEVSGGGLQGIAIGPDDRFYVVQYREPYPAVIVLTPSGELVREIPFPTLGTNSGHGRLCMDHRRNIGYLTSGPGIYRFSLTGGLAEYLDHGGFACSVLPNGDYLLATGGNIQLMRGATTIGEIGALVLESGEPADWGLHSSRGVHYSEGQKAIFATSYNGFRLFKLKGVSNVLVGETYFHYGDDIAELPDGIIFVGSSSSSQDAAFFDPQLLQIGQIVGSDAPHSFVATYPASHVIFFSSFD